MNLSKQTIIILSFFLSVRAVGQQTPSFSDYYYNPLLINPGYTGMTSSLEINLSSYGSLESFEGSPRTFTASLNAPIAVNSMGISGGIVVDRIGVTNITKIFVGYAYKIEFDSGYNKARWWKYEPRVFSFGINAGGLFYNENLTSLNIPDDPNFENDLNELLPSFGVGIVYNHENFYLGISTQNLFANISDESKNISINNPYYAYGGYKIYLGRFNEFRFLPSFLIKLENGAPAQIDLNTTLNYKNKIEIGGGYRSKTSFNALIGLYVAKKIRFAYNYNMFNSNTPFPNAHGIIFTIKSGEGFRQ